MQEDEQSEAEGRDGPVAIVRKVSEVVYPGCEPVIVRTTRLDGHGSQQERRVRAGLRRLAREGRSTGLIG
jgi:hypothetical protein